MGVRVRERGGGHDWRKESEPFIMRNPMLKSEPMKLRNPGHLSEPKKVSNP